MRQISNEIIKLAKRFNANIAIERLRHPRKRRGERTRKSTRKANCIPYRFLRHALSHVAEIVAIREAKPNYTSQTYPQCRHIDRVASLNIAEMATSPSTIPMPSLPSGIPQSTDTIWKDEEVERQRLFTSEFQAPPTGKDS